MQPLLARLCLAGGRAGVEDLEMPCRAELPIDRRGRPAGSNAAAAAGMND